MGARYYLIPGFDECRLQYNILIRDITTGKAETLVINLMDITESHSLYSMINAAIEKLENGDVRT